MGEDGTKSLARARSAEDKRNHDWLAQQRFGSRMHPLKAAD